MPETVEDDEPAAAPAAAAPAAAAPAASSHAQLPWSMPLRDTNFLLNEVFDAPAHYKQVQSELSAEAGGGEDAEPLTPDFVDMINREGAKFAEEVGVELELGCVLLCVCFALRVFCSACVLLCVCFALRVFCCACVLLCVLP